MRRDDPTQGLFSLGRLFSHPRTKLATCRCDEGHVYMCLCLCVPCKHVAMYICTPCVLGTSKTTYPSIRSAVNTMTWPLVICSSNPLRPWHDPQHSSLSLSLSLSLSKRVFDLIARAPCSSDRWQTTAYQSKPTHRPQKDNNKQSASPPASQPASHTRHPPHNKYIQHANYHPNLPSTARETKPSKTPSRQRQ